MQSVSSEGGVLTDTYAHTLVVVRHLQGHVGVEVASKVCLFLYLYVELQGTREASKNLAIPRTEESSGEERQGRKIAKAPSAQVGSLGVGKDRRSLT